MPTIDKVPADDQPHADERPLNTAADPRLGNEKQPSQKLSLPLIAFNNRPLREVVDDCLKAAKLANTPPRLFQQGNILTRIRCSDQEAFLEPMTIDSLRGFLERVATFSQTYRKGSEIKAVLKPLPLDYVRDILALPSWPEDVFPTLNGITRCPFFAPDGQLVITPGYHAGSKIWYAPAPGLMIEPVSAAPTDTEIDHAKHWLMNELLGDFPFQSDADKANALAFLLTPFVREMIQGPVPLGLLEAPAAGTGKGLLANTLTMLATGNVLETIPQRQSDDEWRKAITAKLLEMPTHILFDNLTGTLRSAALEAALTSELWADRFLGETRIIRMKIKTIWLATGNNLQIAGDLYRRTVWIRLDAKMEHPEDRKPTDFKHPQILVWAKANRGTLIWAVLTIIQAWIARGKRPGIETMGSYESWASILGGILAVVGVKDFLKNLQTSRINADDELVQLASFVEAWNEEHGQTEVTIGELYELVAKNDHLLPFVMEPDKEHGRKVRLGRYISKQRDRTVGTIQIVEVSPDNRSRTKRYRLKQLQRKGTRDDEPEAEQAADESSRPYACPADSMDTTPRPGDADPEELEGNKVYMPTGESIDIDALVKLYRHWWFIAGNGRIPASGITEGLVRLGLIAGRTPAEKAWRTCELLSVLVGHTIDIFRLEGAGYSEVNGENQAYYYLVVEEGETPPETQAELGDAKSPE